MYIIHIYLFLYQSNLCEDGQRSNIQSINIAFRVILKLYLYINSSCAFYDLLWKHFLRFNLIWGAGGIGFMRLQKEKKKYFYYKYSYFGFYWDSLVFKSPSVKARGWGASRFLSLFESGLLLRNDWIRQS